uniref:Uncharacterized protein n=1 Tax=Utricularia reniformis TaxID=192314 RepID=A0A1Y0B4R7_9LAMI|nr:hypothetical protein AEK19_MT2248 [Utricularia reniformis]ART32393.1 hypothetical protein AEK19_MT2248 [Utricularia reniformis]
MRAVLKYIVPVIDDGFAKMTVSYEMAQGVISSI